MNREQEKNYLRTRNDILMSQQRDSSLSRFISGLPFPHDTHLDTAVIRNLPGSESVKQGGWSEGFDPVTGDLRLVKKWTINSVTQHLAVIDRLEVLENFSGLPGLCTMEEAKTLTGDTLRQAEVPFEFCMVQKLAERLWLHREAPGEAKATNSRLRRAILQSLLSGLATMHGKGWCHGAVMSQFIQLFPESEWAAFFDLDNILKNKTLVTRNIRYIQAYPHEIPLDKATPFDTSADIYMLALVLTRKWFEDDFKGLDHRKENEHAILMTHLELHTVPLSRLLRQMLQWKPEDRPSADKALEDKQLYLAEPQLIKNKRKRDEATDANTTDSPVKTQKTNSGSGMKIANFR
ncbi:uncharacterized protein KY384_006294 [Bacidia gigantensis]|uniref:uncharacterized protein n=1 Tax=Bacidia gigantensis TaxID=2732470 RepID=UPI001D047475|nr:uncharacterized protein KY384_006294 [Bacidia gigantensis]KAG8528607.1 hypothetical protein KY384_006294 [Bacidia gigantensis]